MITCSQNFESTNAVNCMGVTTDTNSTGTGDYYAYCLEPFDENNNAYVRCPTGTLSTTDLTSIPAGSYVFSTTSYTSENNKIRYPFNLTSTPIEIIQENATTESSLILSGLVSEFNPTAFSLLLLATLTGMTTGFVGGMITGTIRKVKNARI